MSKFLSFFSRSFHEILFSGKTVPKFNSHSLESIDPSYLIDLQVS